MTNANTDDRRHPLCTEKLVQALEDNPEAGLAYCDIAITNEENSDFYDGKVVDHYFWLNYDHINLLRRCEVGPMPVWRASLHDEIGLLTNGSLVPETTNFGCVLQKSIHLFMSEKFSAYT
ncbi:hypothetical protein ADUPG1_001174 [Aduncisulcus paluster]|uniref:Uncharacterized protein n=1 Tax=Aduncisulcus paluster TaxID=2918883 RepID=A0ABQ5KA22_9EUKA|nr:hypothetical protein ADUPG1_001174 [Aduncisulcus paluster]